MDGDFFSDTSVAALQFVSVGDRALQIVLGDRLDLALNRRALALSEALEDLPGLTDRVPAYASLTLHYDPMFWSQANLIEAVIPILAAAEDRAVAGRMVTIPVCYGHAYGPDLAEVARHAGIDPEEVITRHCQAEYRVCFLGFTPGFAYLSGLDPSLAMARRATPRSNVSAGSVGIAGNQTGIYPQASPGGWQLIGRTPLRLFDPCRDPPCLLSPGDRLRFVAIDHEEFEQWARREST